MTHDGSAMEQLIFANPSGSLSYSGLPGTDASDGVFTCNLLVDREEVAAKDSIHAYVAKDFLEFALRLVDSLTRRAQQTGSSTTSSLTRSTFFAVMRGAWSLGISNMAMTPITEWELRRNRPCQSVTGVGT